MASVREIYKCEQCGNIVELLHGGDGALVCCGKDMKKMVENTVDASKEKHVPQIEKVENGYKVSVGSVPHPMLAEHYIEWIELWVGDKKVQRTYLMPGEEPVAYFTVCPKCADLPVSAREYCNLHGLWKS